MLNKINANFNDSCKFHGALISYNQVTMVTFSLWKISCIREKS